MSSSTSAMAAVLEVAEMDAYYGDLQVLSGLRLNVHEQEIVTLVGSNGAGKTTTINAISGITVRATGRIRFFGEEVSNVPAHARVARGLVHVPEGRRLFPFMTVRENVELGAYPARARSERDETLENVLALLPRLKERLGQTAGTLSGGEQQMVAIGRGLMAKPKLLMLDEPTLGLAPKMVSLVFETIEVIRQLRIPILLVEQNVKHCLTMADRGYVLENGRVVLEGVGKALLADDRLRTAYLGL